VHDFTFEEKKKLLFFATGSDRVRMDIYIKKDE
jgi:hypothetical protein